MDAAAGARDGRGLPGEGDRISRGDGGARKVPATVSCMRVTGATDCVCRERGELLCAVPDGRQASRGSLALAPHARRLAEDARRNGGAQEDQQLLVWAPRSRTLYDDWRCLRPSCLLALLGVRYRRCRL